MLDTNQEPSPLLRDANGHPVALTGVSVRGRLSETLASVEVEQRYLNPFDHNIEAVLHLSAAHRRRAARPDG